MNRFAIGWLRVVLSRPCARKKAQEQGTVLLWQVAATSEAAGLWALWLRLMLEVWRVAVALPELGADRGLELRRGGRQRRERR